MLQDTKVLKQCLVPYAGCFPNLTERNTGFQVTCSLSLCASIGITFRIGSSSTRTFGLGLRRHAASTSQEAPSRYRPLTKQPECALSVTSPAVLYLVTVVYKVERSNGQPFLRQVACTRAVRYDSGICRPDNQITAGSPSLTYKQSKRKYLTSYYSGGICVEKGPDVLTVLHLEPPRVSLMMVIELNGVQVGLKSYA